MDAGDSDFDRWVQSVVVQHCQEAVVYSVAVVYSDFAYSMGHYEHHRMFDGQDVVEADALAVAFVDCQHQTELFAELSWQLS